MSKRILICDDSRMARKQLARNLPNDWQVEVEFAEGGAIALERVRQGDIDLMFLDLNMPEPDGYQVLQQLASESHPTEIIVVSGDIQPRALERVSALGAREFIRKPASPDELKHLLSKHGWYAPSDAGSRTVFDEAAPLDMLDAYREVVNVAMGRAGSLLSTALNDFVRLPIPRVNLLEVSELHMAMQAVHDVASLSAVCQGFIGEGIRGEAMLLLDDTQADDIASMLNIPKDDDYNELEVLMDLSNLLVGSCLKGVSEQLGSQFSIGQPVILGQQRRLQDLIDNNKSRWQRTLAIEVTYAMESSHVQCDLLLLFTEESMRAMNEKVGYLVGAE